MKKIFKKYWKSIVKYAFLALIIYFSIGLPTAFWTMNMIKGEEQPEQGRITIRYIAKISHAVLSIDRKP